MKRLFFRQRRRRLLIILLVFLTILAGYGVYNAILMKAKGVEEHYTHRGEIKQYSLRDGSQLKLDTESRAVVAYDNGSRAVELLSGRARFAVSENREEQRPFRSPPMVCGWSPVTATLWWILRIIKSPSARWMKP